MAAGDQLCSKPNTGGGGGGGGAWPVGFLLGLPFEHPSSSQSTLLICLHINLEQLPSKKTDHEPWDFKPNNPFGTP